MKPIYFLPVIALSLTPLLPQQSMGEVHVEVAAVDEGAEGSSEDLFQNATPTEWSPVFGKGEDGRLEEVKEMFGHFVDEPPSRGATLFVPSPSNEVFMVEFRTEEPVSFSKVQVILEEDRKGETKGDRSVERMRLYGRAGAGPFGEEDLLFEAPIKPDYAEAYGSFRVQLTVTGLAASELQHFRMEFVGTPIKAGAGIGGPRVTEVDAFQ